MPDARTHPIKWWDPMAQGWIDHPYMFDWTSNADATISDLESKTGSPGLAATLGVDLALLKAELASTATSGPAELQKPKAQPRRSKKLAEVGTDAYADCYDATLEDGGTADFSDAAGSVLAYVAKTHEHATTEELLLDMLSFDDGALLRTMGGDWNVATLNLMLSCAHKTESVTERVLAKLLDVGGSEYLNRCNRAFTAAVPRGYSPTARKQWAERTAEAERCSSAPRPATTTALAASEHAPSFYSPAARKQWTERTAEAKRRTAASRPAITTALAASAHVPPAIVARIISMADEETLTSEHVLLHKPLEVMLNASVIHAPVVDAVFKAFAPAIHPLEPRDAHGTLPLHTALKNAHKFPSMDTAKLVLGKLSDGIPEHAVISSSSGDSVLGLACQAYPHVPPDLLCGWVGAAMARAHAAQAVEAIRGRIVAEGRLADTDWRSTLAEGSFCDYLAPVQAQEGVAAAAPETGAAALSSVAAGQEVLAHVDNPELVETCLSARAWREGIVEKVGTDGKLEIRRRSHARGSEIAEVLPRSAKEVAAPYTKCRNWRMLLAAAGNVGVRLAGTDAYVQGTVVSIDRKHGEVDVAVGGTVFKRISLGGDDIQEGRVSMSALGLTIAPGRGDAERTAPPPPAHLPPDGHPDAVPYAQARILWDHEDAGRAGGVVDATAANGWRDDESETVTRVGGYLPVLAREGFLAGKHQWTITRAENTRFGVAVEGVDRTRWLGPVPGEPAGELPDGAWVCGMPTPLHGKQRGFCVGDAVLVSAQADPSHTDTDAVPAPTAGGFNLGGAQPVPDSARGTPPL